MGIEGVDGGLGAEHLGRAAARIGVDDLPLQVGQRHGVVVDDADGADTRRAEIEQDRRAEPPCPYDQHPRRLQPLLPRPADLPQDDVAGIAFQFDVGERARRRGRLPFRLHLARAGADPTEPLPVEPDEGRDAAQHQPLPRPATQRLAQRMTVGERDLHEQDGDIEEADHQQARLRRCLHPPAEAPEGGGEEKDENHAPVLPRPVEPKPPVPRAVSSRTATSAKAACTTGATTAWAIRMPWVTSKGAAPRLTRITPSGPR